METHTHRLVSSWIRSREWVRVCCGGSQLQLWTRVHRKWLTVFTVYDGDLITLAAILYTCWNDLKFLFMPRRASDRSSEWNWDGVLTRSSNPLISNSAFQHSSSPLSVSSRFIVVDCSWRTCSKCRFKGTCASLPELLYTEGGEFAA